MAGGAPELNEKMNAKLLPTFLDGVCRAAGVSITIWKETSIFLTGHPVWSLSNMFFKCWLPQSSLRNTVYMPFAISDACGWAVSLPHTTRMFFCCLLCGRICGIR